MSKSPPIDADAVFAELDAVAATFPRLQGSQFWASEGPRLPTSLQDVTGALAYAAYSDFPDDERRWRAGTMLLQVPGAFKDMTSSETSAAWNSVILRVEAEVLASPSAPEAAVAVAFRHATSRILKTMETADAAGRDAALRTFDELAGKPSGAKASIDSLPALIAALERLNMRPELLARLTSMAASEDDRIRTFAEGRLRLLESWEVPLDFSFQDITGTSIGLDKMRGQVVLIQFWASWCAPCRAEIPFLRTAFDAYKDRGFQIVGVSLDKLNGDENYERARTRVMAFIKENRMDWPIHFDGLWWDNACAKRLGIRSLPASMLLGQDGRTIAVNLRDDGIALKLESLLG